MPKNRRHDIVKPSKYKTTLCSFFYSKDGCPFGERCAFAHGMEELRHETTEEKAAAAAAPPASGGGVGRDEGITGGATAPEVTCSTSHVTSSDAQAAPSTSVGQLSAAGGDTATTAVPDLGTYHSSVPVLHQAASQIKSSEAALADASAPGNERCEVSGGGGTRAGGAEVEVGLAAPHVALTTPMAHLGIRGPHRRPGPRCGMDEGAKMYGNVATAWQGLTTGSAVDSAALCRDTLGGSSTTLPSGIAQHPYFNINNHHHINVVPAAPATFLVATGPPPFVGAQAHKVSHPPPRVLQSSMPERRQPRIRHVARTGEAGYMVYHPSTAPPTTPMPCGAQGGSKAALSPSLVMPAIVPPPSTLSGGPLALTVAAAGPSMHDMGLGPPGVALMPPGFGYDAHTMSGVLGYTNVTCQPPHPELTPATATLASSATMQVPLSARCEAAMWPSTAAAYYYMAAQQQQQLFVDAPTAPAQQPPSAPHTDFSPSPRACEAAGSAPLPQRAGSAAVGSSAGQADVSTTPSSTALYELFGGTDGPTLTMPPAAEVEEGLLNDLGSEWAALMERWMLNLKDDTTRGSPVEVEAASRASPPSGGANGAQPTTSVPDPLATTAETQTENGVAAPLGSLCPPSLRGRPLQVQIDAHSASHPATTRPEMVGGASDKAAACPPSVQVKQQLGFAKPLSTVRASSGGRQRICAILWEGVKASLQRRPIVSNQFKSSCKAESTLNSILLDYPEQASLPPVAWSTALSPRPGIEELFRGVKRRKVPARTRSAGQGSVVAELLSSAKEDGAHPAVPAASKKVAAPPPTPPPAPRGTDDADDDAMSIEYYI